MFFYIQFFLLGLGGSIFGPLIPILSESFNVSLDTIGTTLSLSAFGLLLSSLFTGILSERTGKKNIFTLGSILFTACFLGLYFSNHFTYFTLSYITFGICWGIIAVSSTSVISDTFHLNRSKMIMRLNTGFLMGSFTAPLLVSGILYLNIDWRYIFLSVALLNVLLFILILSLKTEGLNNRKHEENLRSLLTTNRRLLSNLITIFCGVIYFLHLGAGFTFGSWLTTYFNNQNVPVTIGSLILSLYLLTFAIGMFVKSSLFAKLNEKKIIQFSSILAFITLTAFLFLDPLIFKIIFVILFSLSFSGIATTALSIGIHQNPRNSGSVISIINSFGFTGVVIFQYTAGYMSENFSVDFVIYLDLAALFLLMILTSILSSHHRFSKS